MCRGKAAKTYARLSKQKLAPDFPVLPCTFPHFPALSCASLRFLALPSHFAYTSLDKAHSPPTSLRNLPDQFPNIRPKLSSI